MNSQDLFNENNSGLLIQLICVNRAMTGSEVYTG